MMLPFTKRLSTTVYRSRKNIAYYQSAAAFIHHNPEGKLITSSKVPITISEDLQDTCVFTPPDIGHALQAACSTQEDRLKLTFHHDTQHFAPSM